MEYSRIQTSQAVPELRKSVNGKCVIVYITLKPVDPRYEPMPFTVRCKPKTNQIETC